jgi:hypothetical protein
VQKHRSFSNTETKQTLVYFIWTFYTGWLICLIQEDPMPLFNKKKILRTVRCFKLRPSKFCAHVNIKKKKKKKTLSVRNVAQVVEHLSSKCKALRWNPSSVKKKKEKRKKKKFQALVSTFLWRRFFHNVGMIYTKHSNRLRKQKYVHNSDNENTTHQLFYFFI